MDGFMDERVQSYFCLGKTLQAGRLCEDAVNGTYDQEETLV